MEPDRRRDKETTSTEQSRAGAASDNPREVRTAATRVVYTTSHGHKLPEINKNDGYGIYDCNVSKELDTLRLISGPHALSVDYTLYALMANTMYNEAGVGLAAPQIGLNERLIVVDYHWPTTGIKAPWVLINPEIIEQSDEMQVSKEACLSVPGIQVEVPRAKRIKLKAHTLNYDEILMEESGYGAAVIQHELDHLNGLLLIDYLSALRKDMYKRKIAKIKKRAKIIAQQSMKLV